MIGLCIVRDSATIHKDTDRRTRISGNHASVQRGSDDAHVLGARRAGQVFGCHFARMVGRYRETLVIIGEVFNYSY